MERVLPPLQPRGASLTSRHSLDSSRKSLTSRLSLDGLRNSLDGTRDALAARLSLESRRLSVEERRRLSYQDDDSEAVEAEVAAGDGGVRLDGPALHAWRGQSLAQDVAAGRVPPDAVPNPPRDGGAAGGGAGAGIDVEMEGLGGGDSRERGEQQQCGSCVSSKIWHHTRILVWKNYATSKRHLDLMVMQVLSFAVFVFLLFMLQEMAQSRLMAEELHPPITTLGGIPKCVAFNGAPCTTIRYEPKGHPEVEFLMRELAAEQGLVMGRDILPMETSPQSTNRSKAWSDFWLAHPNQTLTAVSFLDRSPRTDWVRACPGVSISDTSTIYPSGECALPDIIRYKIFYNDTTRYSRASRTYTPFYPLDVTRQVQRALDEAIITLRGRHAGQRNCETTLVDVGPSSAGPKAFTVAVAPGQIYSSATLRCADGKRCAFNDADYEGVAAPAGSIARAHLDPSGQGPNDWYLMPGRATATSRSFTVGRYDSAVHSGWTFDHLQLAVELCRPNWRANLQVQTKSMPVVGDEKVEELLGEGVFLAFGVLFFYCGAVFNYFLLMLNIVREKEHKLRNQMLIMGLSRGSVWLSWLVYSMVMNTVAALMTIGAGYLCGFAYFRHSNPAVVMLTFWMFSLAMTAFSFFASAVVSTERTAVVIGFLLFVVGTFFQVIVGAGTFYFYEPDISPIYRRVMYHYPPFNFAKLFVGIGMKIGQENYEGMLDESAGPVLYYSWSDLCSGEYPLLDNMFYLVMNFFEWFFAAWYLDYILTADNGKPQPCYFLCLPSFWGCSSKRGDKAATASGRSFVGVDIAGLGLSAQPAIQVSGLDKTFRTGSCGRPSKTDVHALKAMDLTIRNQRVYCLLGPNGAGKTTLLSLLTGSHQPSAGEAFVCGHSVTDHMDELRELIGVCPQHDILWPDMTAREHLAMFADIRGTPQAEIPAFVDAKLQEILLHKVADVPAGKFSGGMKRRLSIGISSIGDPKVIFLDEPTTGTDPGNRRMIWSLIDKVKQGRCIVLTTHAMDEADLLSDEIGIMLRGQLFCSGNAISLKNRFGVGYRLMVRPLPGKEMELLQLMQRSFPDFPEAASRPALPPRELHRDGEHDRQDQVLYGSGIELPPVVVSDAPGDVRTFLVPKERKNEFASVLEKLESQAAAAQLGDTPRGQQVAQDWSMSHATLEEVFMAIVRGNSAESSKSTQSTGFINATADGSEADPQDSSEPSALRYIGLMEFAAKQRQQLNNGGASLQLNNGGGGASGSPSRTISQSRLDHRMARGKSQVVALLHKNVAWQKRQKCTNCCQIIIPAILLFIVVIIQAVVDSTFEAKSRWQIQYHVPKEVDVENLAPAILKELQLDESQEYLNDIGQYCYSGMEGDTVELFCPKGNITEIKFASFGLPKGSCNNLEIRPACHAPNSTTQVESRCLGQVKCFVPATSATFVWSARDSRSCDKLFDDSDGDDDHEKRLEVRIQCSGHKRDRLNGVSTGFGAADQGLREVIDLAVQNSAAGPELTELLEAGVSDLSFTGADALDFFVENGALTSQQTNRVDLGVVDVGNALGVVGVDVDAQLGQVVSAQLSALNRSVDVNVATLLGRDNLTFTTGELLLNSTADPGLLNSSQLTTLQAIGLAQLATGGGVADIPIDVGRALGLSGGTTLTLTSAQLGTLLNSANITLGDLLGFDNNTQLDLQLEFNASNFALLTSGTGANGNAVQERLDITAQVEAVFNSLVGTQGLSNGADLTQQGIEILVEDTIEATIVNFFLLTNTPPLTPPLMFWSTPKIFTVNPGNGVARDRSGWLEQIDKEVAASKKELFRILNSQKYNHRMRVQEFIPLAVNFLSELPFAAFIFDPANSVSEGHFNYTIQVETEQVYLSWWLPVQLFYGVDPRNVLLNFVDSSIAWGLDGRTRIDTEIQAMDYEFNEARALNVADQLAYILFPFALTFLLPVFMSIVVYEKEEKLRELMKMSGLQMRYYWLVNYAYNYLMYFVVVFAFSIACFMVQIRLWTQTSSIVLFLLLFLWGHALIALANLFTAFLDRNLASSLAGYIIVVAGVLASLVFNGTVFYRDAPPVLYMLYAPLAFYRAIFIMTTSCTRYKCVGMEDLHSEMVACYLYLILDTIIYWILFLWLDKVLPAKWGVPQPPLFCLRPIFRRCRRFSGGDRDQTEPEGGEHIEARNNEPDADVVATDANPVGSDQSGLRQRRSAAAARAGELAAVEQPSRQTEKTSVRRRKALQRTESADSLRERRRVETGNIATIQMYGLHHTYDRGVLGRNKGRVALIDLFLSIDHNECVALLGPNGAGKSTLISILTGLFQPTAGTATIDGRDIRTEMDDIHKLIGICPQFSILWAHLTCAEHLCFFARLKGVPQESLATFVASALEKVGLTLAADRLASNLSVCPVS